MERLTDPSVPARLTSGSWLCLLAALLLSLPTSAWSGQTGLFDRNDTLSLRLEMPMSQFLAERKRTERSYLDGRLSLPDVDASRAIPLRLKMIGRMRAEICDIPGMKFRLEPGDVAGTPLAGHRQLYFTTHCRNQRGFEQYLVGEYLIYKSFALISEISYRARLVKVTYVDLDGKDHRTGTRLGMLVEHQDHMAERLGYRPVYPEQVRRDQMDPLQAARVCLFQYMIGNTDYSLLSAAPGDPCCHNMQLIGDDQGTVLTVPYDFDYAGVINASYAVPARGLPITRVTQRAYRGLCNLNAHLPATTARFLDNRSAILELYRAQAELDQRNRRRAMRFLQPFFELLNDPEAVRDLVEQHCH